MSVRVSVRFQNQRGEPHEAVCILNGGFETEEPCVLFPRAAAETVLTDPTRGRPVGARVASGEITLLLSEEGVTAQVTSAERDSPQTRCAVLVSDGGDEILISDTAIDALGVEIKSFGRGTWRFTGEDRLRQSDPPRIW